MTTDDRTPTPFGWWLSHLMANHQPPVDTQSELSRLINATPEAKARGIRVAQSTISRWLYEDGQPDPAKVILLAGVFNVDPGEILHRAGYGRPVAPRADSGQVDPLLAKLGILLGRDSPLPADRAAKLRSHIELVVEPYEQYLPGIRRVV